MKYLAFAIFVLGSLLLVVPWIVLALVLLVPDCLWAAFTNNMNDNRIQDCAFAPLERFNAWCRRLGGVTK